MLRTLLRRRHEEDGVSMVLAIMLAIILASLVSTMTVLAILKMQNSAAVRDATYFDVATNTAISDVLNLANNPGDDNITNHVGMSKAKSGVVAGDTKINWRWYLKPVESSFSGLSYDVIVTGYRNSPSDPLTSRTITARMVSFPTDGARKIDDSVFYRPTPSSIFSWGIFGSNGSTLTGNTKVQSFNSGVNGSVAANAQVGSNENVTISNTATVPKVFMMNTFPGHTTTERCTGAPCNPNDATEATYGMDVTVVNEWVQDACQGKPTPDVSGSEITFTGGEVNCFGNVNLSGDVKINHTGTAISSGNPAKIYIKGNLTIEPGARFNNQGNSSVSGAMIYHMYVGGTNVNIASTGIGTRSTDFRALVAAGSANCSIGTLNATTATSGALICGKIVTSGNTTINWDEQTGQITGDRTENRRIWNITGYKNN
jgi:hypothetical protein